MSDEPLINELRRKLLTDSDGMTYFVKGHVDIPTFCAAVGVEYGYKVEPLTVRHIWMHYGPHGDMAGSDYAYYMHLHSEGGRGRFKATYWEAGF